MEDIIRDRTSTSFFLTIVLAEIHATGTPSPRCKDVAGTDSITPSEVSWSMEGRMDLQVLQNLPVVMTRIQDPRRLGSDIVRPLLLFFSTVGEVHYLLYTPGPTTVK